MNTEKTFTISIFSENSPGVLHRITTVFTRRKINVESLTVSETEQHDISRFTIVVKLSEALVTKVVAQIQRIVEVRSAYATEDSELYFKEIAFIKVRTESANERREVEEISRQRGAAIVAVKPETIVVEQTGSEEEIRSLYLLLEPFGIAEFIRSGRIAIRKE
jgi:acetolactate synthase-1/3 small subunit